MFLDLTCDEACFRFGIESLKVANAFTWRVLRPQGFFFALNVVPDDAAGDVEDGLLQAGLQIRDLLAENPVGDAAAEQRQHDADDESADDPSEDAADEDHEERRHG